MIAITGAALLTNDKHGTLGVTNNMPRIRAEEICAHGGPMRAHDDQVCTERFSLLKYFVINPALPYGRGYTRTVQTAFPGNNGKCFLG